MSTAANRTYSAATNQRIPSRLSASASLKGILVVAAVVILVLWVALTTAVLRQGSTATPTSTLTPMGVRKALRRHESSSAAVDACSQRRDCLECLYPASTLSNASLHESAKSCMWCASTRSCAPSSQVETCDDAESDVCPSVLWIQPPQNHRVIHVGIRKGGPEALVQMHLALNYWGFKTTLDTRKSMKEKGGPVMPFFLESYKEEFSRAPALRWVKNYDDWHQSAEEGDVLIATETWACKPNREHYLPTGVRQFQWHLTVWPRRDRSQCTIAGHTHYVARDYMRQSVRSLMYPYISPHIIALAATRPSWRDRKRDLVLYDSDTHLKDSDLESNVGVRRERRLASGLTPQQLYEFYQTAKAGIDLQLPGGERFIYEAALFDVCVIVDDAVNGADHEDFPIPEQFRVKPNDKVALNAAVDACIRDYDKVIDGFAPLKQLVLKQRVTFLRQVRRYFSNSVHVVTVACRQSEVDALAVRFLLASIIQIPFAVIEFLVPEGVTFTTAAWQTLRENSHLAAVFFTTMTKQDALLVCDSRNPRAGEADVETYSKYVSSAATVVRPSTNSKRSLFVLWLPLSAVVMSEDVVHRISTELGLQHRRRLRSPADPTPAVVLRIDHERTPQNSPAAFGHFLVGLAYFTSDADSVRSHLHSTTASSDAAGSWLIRSSSSFPESRSSSSSFFDQRIVTLSHSSELDRAAELISIVDSDGTMLWGGQQLFDESVQPFLCGHELWRTLVVDGKPWKAGQLRCVAASD